MKATHTTNMTMRYRCPRCGQSIAADAQQPPTTCPNCDARLTTAEPVAIPAPGTMPPPIVVPMPVAYPADPFDFVEEKKADLRERREARQEDRRHYNEDRSSNPLGMIGFAVTVTTALVLLSGWTVAKSLPAYLYITASLAVPCAIAGLVMSIIGVLKPSRQRIFAATGAILGAVEVLFMLPMSFALRDILLAK